MRMSVLPQVAPKFEALDLESASGRYHTVTCLDVMIHYPQVLLRLFSVGHKAHFSNVKRSASVVFTRDHVPF